MLYEIVYWSRRTQTLTDGDIVSGIVFPARRRNRDCDVTGCLWFDESRFVQVLEGRREDVELIFGAIRRDVRHRDVHVIAQGPIERRAFSKWNMTWLQHDGAPVIDELITRYSKPIAAEERAGSQHAATSDRASAESGHRWLLEKMKQIFLGGLRQRPEDAM
ncbi:MAG TPA: BLUF domain-containing protein [Phycisphaerales bacterium]|nr:BLUF domain-containing protein [Phycisphaerales bacterium]